MSTEKIKITVRFVVEQDFEVEVTNPKLGLGSVFCVGDNMVCHGMDVHDLTTSDNIFDNPVGDTRPLGGDFVEANPVSYTHLTLPTKLEV